MNMVQLHSTWDALLGEITVVSVLVRLGLSVLIGGILGAERGMRNRPAGFTTYVMVCLGAALVMLTNQYICTQYPQTDPTRLGAQVVSGIGFLGAGTILVTRKEEIRGLTTAAGLWVAAGLGLAVGTGFYLGAIVGCFFSVFSLVALRKIDLYIKKHARSMEIYLEYNATLSIRALSEYMEEKGYNLYEMQRGNIRGLEKELGTLVFTLNLPRRTNHQGVLKNLYTIDGVEYVREIA